MEVGAMKRILRLWTQEETDILLAMKVAGFKFRDIADKLGRPAEGVKERFRYLHLTEDERAARRERKNALRFGKRTKPAKRVSYIRRTYPDFVFEDRARRLSADQTISQMLLGDPLPGQSALDRRQSA